MLRRLNSDERGTTLVEFALLAPTLMLMVTGAVEFGHLAMARSALEGATMVSARVAMTGACPESREEDMQNFIHKRMSSFATVADVSGKKSLPEITVRNFGQDVGNVGSPEPFVDDDKNGEYTPGESFDDLNGNGKWTSGVHVRGDLGGPGDVIQYEAEFKAANLFPYTKWFVESGHATLKASTIVRNEPIFSGECANIEQEEAS
ncbi:MAG: TadE/TadG family type IV pilus assembly protein [Pseudomonadota bacterium]